MRVETILLVDDDALVLRALERQLQRAGKHVLATEDAAEASMLSLSQRPELAIVDVLLGPGGIATGLDLIERLRKDREELAIIAHSGVATAEIVVFAHEAGADVAVGKDMFQLDELLSRVETGIPLRRRAPERVASVGRVKWEHLQHVVRAFGSVRRAANMLEMSRSSLQRALKRQPPH